MSKKIASVLASIIILAAIIVGIVLLVQQHKEEIDDIINPNFGVVYQDKTYRGTSNGVVLPQTGQAVFAIKGASTATVKVVPNYKFTYKVNGVEHHFEEHDDLTNVFIDRSNIFADYFIIACSEGNFSVESVLRSLYESDAELELPQLPKTYPFRLVVTSNTGEEIWLQFGQGEGFVDSGMNPDHVVF